jgi:hypothetical protein
MQIEMSTIGPYVASSLITTFLTVQTTPLGIASIPGQGWYIQGTNVVLTAPASINLSSNTRYSFSYWDIDGVSQANGISTLTLSMNANHTATAHYSTQYLLTVLADPIGVATVPGAGWYNGGTLVTLTAPSIQYYQFNDWDVDGSFQGNGVNPITITMNTAHTATAHYTTTSSSIPDIAITNVTSLKNIIGRGIKTHINVTVANQGGTAETFNITLYANNASIAQQACTLPARSFRTVAFSWDTAGFAYGNYTVWAYVSPVPGETNTSNNKYVFGIVKVTIPGDVNGDFRVTLLDVVMITSIYGTKLGNPKFNPNCDILGIGQITILDVIACTSHYGQKYP